MGETEPNVKGKCDENVHWRDRIHLVRRIAAQFPYPLAASPMSIRCAPHIFLATGRLLVKNTYSQPPDIWYNRDILYRLWVIAGSWSLG